MTMSYLGNQMPIGLLPQSHYLQPSSGMDIDYQTTSLILSLTLIGGLLLLFVLHN
jgi:hypothetical protein